jgi:hypothetical protein
MKCIGVSLTVLSLVVPLGGCEALAGILLPNRVVVSLVNTSDFEVQGELFISDQGQIPRLLLTEIGERQEFTLPSGGSSTFTWSCDELQAIVIDDADLMILGGVGPEANSDVLRDHDDFSCGDRITFTFSHSAEILDFDITSTIE